MSAFSSDSDRTDTMLVRLNSVVRSAMSTLAVTSLAIAFAMPAAAQNAQTEGRWQAWLGCWTPAGTLIRTIGKSATSVVCVVPTSTASAVDVVTVSAGKIVDRTHVDTDGQPHALAKQGCTGWQTAKKRVQLGGVRVPGIVIDVMLGRSYPYVLAVKPLGYRVPRQSTDSAYK